MVTELVRIKIKPGMEAEYEAALKSAAPILKRAKGFRSLVVMRSHEYPSQYRMIVQWDTLENHTVDFRGSADYEAYRKIIGHCFAAPPELEHAYELQGY